LFGDDWIEERGRGIVDAAEMLEWLRDGYWWGGPGETFVVPLGRPATVEDLRITKLKAEIVGGRLVVIGPAGDLPGSAAGSIAVSLHLHARKFGGGRAFGSRVAYLVDLPGRQAICPDAAWHAGQPGDSFPRGAPAFAVEVRDEPDDGPEFEARFAVKRADYFAAGTQVVWDVDVMREHVVRVYRASDPEHPAVYHRGEVAEAEPAVPGWTMPVDEMYE
jgi:Uma2 family endonuclease